MKLANTTNFPDDRIRELIQFVKPSNLQTSNFDVRVTNSNGEYCGVFYANGGYAEKGIGSNPNRPLILARVSPDEKKFPYQENHNQRTRTVKLYYEKYNEKKGLWEGWHTSHPIAITKAYIVRKNRENRNKGKCYDWKKSTGGYIDTLILSREEALVHILAHELRHFWHNNHPGKRGKVWGARGRYSDKDADAYAIRKQRQWRKLYAVDIYPEQPDIIPITS